MAEVKPAIPNCHQRVRRSFQNTNASGNPKISATPIARGKPMNQNSGNAHQVPVRCASPTPQVANVAAVTPITAATPSIDIVRKTDLAVGPISSPYVVGNSGTAALGRILPPSVRQLSTHSGRSPCLRQNSAQPRRAPNIRLNRGTSLHVDETIVRMFGT